MWTIGGHHMALVNCPECNSQISDNANQCPSCGFITRDNCPECGASRAVNENLCAKCGFPRNADPPLEPEGGDPTVTPAANKPEPKGDDSDELLAACIGPKNTDYYIRVFENFRSARGAASWNWPAFFLTIPWLLYRKMWGHMVLYTFGLPIGLVILTAMIAAIFQDAGAGAAFYYLSYVVIAFVVVPIFANRLYFGHVNNKIRKVKKKHDSPTDQLIEMHRTAGTGGAGAIIVVAFIGVAMIGILAAIAIPAYQDYTIRAQVSEGLNMSEGAKVAVTEFVRDRREWPIDNASAGVAPANEISGQYVSGVRVEEGVVVVSYGNNAHASIQGNSLMIVPDASNLPTVSWDCYSSEIANKWLPAVCRSN
jgi:Tfp pilus assembly major pilin PilA